MTTGTTGNQDRDFAKRLMEAIDRNTIVDAIQGLFENDSAWVLDWVAGNFDPEDVYEQSILASWAERNGYIQEG